MPVLCDLPRESLIDCRQITDKMGMQVVRIAPHCAGTLTIEHLTTEN